jgi:Aromatic-ring-opening dioxygenase LigAB, LigA subunit
MNATSSPGPDDLEALIGPPAGLTDLCLYTPELARAGYRLNRFFAAIAFDRPEAVAAFHQDPEGFMARMGLTEEERGLVSRRDFAGVARAGGQPFVLFRAFGAMGWTPQDLVAGAADGGAGLRGVLHRGGYIEQET